jgi:hypothetical protein
MLKIAYSKKLLISTPSGKGNDEASERKRKLAFPTQSNGRRSLSEDIFLRQVEDRLQEINADQHEDPNVQGENPRANITGGNYKFYDIFLIRKERCSWLRQPI